MGANRGESMTESSAPERGTASGKLATRARERKVREKAGKFTWTAFPALSKASAESPLRETVFFT